MASKSERVGRVSISQRGSGYRLRWRTVLGRQRSHQCDTIKGARQAALAITTAADRGEDWHPRRLAHAPLLGEVIQDYLNDCARRLAPRSVRNLLYILRGYLRTLEAQHGPDVLPTHVTRSSVYAYFDHLMQTSAARSASNRTMEIVKLWRWAWDHDEYGQWFDRPRSVTLPAGTRAKPGRAPSWAQCDEMIAACTVEWCRRLCVLMRYTGLRAGQAGRLLWSDLDMVNHLLTIRPELGKSRQERRGRVVPVPSHLIAEVSGWGVREGTLRGPGLKLTHSNVTLRWAWQRAGVPDDVWRQQPAHAYRHAYVTEMVSRGVPQHLVSALTGHARGVTGDVYTDTAGIMGQLREAVAVIPEIGAAVANVSEMSPRRVSVSGNSND